MALREIRKFEDPVLRKKCRIVEKVDDRIKEILQDMLETLYATPGAGAIAANQIGILKRLVVIDLGEETYKLVNPEVMERTGEQYTVEGCLSFPDTWGKVRRPEYVKVKALNEEGEEIVVEGQGLLAKCLCHEIDHLDGEVFIDKVEEYVEFD